MGRAMGRLAGKRIVLTGAGGMMGADIARTFAREGANLVLSSRTTTKIASLATELAELGVRTAVLPADLTIDAEADRLADRAWEAFGGIDVILLSSQPPEPCQSDLLSVSDADLEAQQKAIAWGPFRVARRIAARMIEAGLGGSIISVTSSTGFEEPVPGYGAYGVAKGTLWMLTRYMAAEWGRHGIRANAFQPGSIATGDDAQAAEFGAKVGALGMLDRTSLGRVGRNSECMGALIYLASDEASYTTGQRLIVNGGRF